MTQRKKSGQSFQIPSMNLIKIAVLVTLVFIGLKLTGYTEIAGWKWIWVLSPLWLPMCALIILLVFLRWYEKS